MLTRKVYSYLSKKISISVSPMELDSAVVNSGSQDLDVEVWVLLLGKVQMKI